MSNEPSRVIPAGWRAVRLGDVSERCLGKMLDAQKNKGRPFPYLRNPNVRWFDVDISNLHEMPFEDHELERYGLRKGDVVICEGGEAGRAAIWDGRLPDVKFQKAIHRVRPGPDLFNRFLVYQLRADYRHGRLADYYTGATIQHLTGQDLSRYELVLPPFEEQRRIADVLDRADALRVMRRAALSQLDELTQVIFVDMFGDRATILLRWPTKPLGGMLDFLTSGSRGWAAHYADAGDLFIRIQNVLRDELVLDDVAYVRAPDTAEARRTCVQPDDVLLSITADLGRTAVVPKGIGVAFINQHLAILRTKALVPRFLSAYLASPVGQVQVSGRNRHAVKAGLNFDDIRSFVVPMPPLALQQDFAHRVAAVEKLKAAHRASLAEKLKAAHRASLAEKLKAAHRASLAEMDALFASLQHRAFRGELRFS